MKKRMLSAILSFCVAVGAYSGAPVLAADSTTLQSLIDAAEHGGTVVLSHDYQESVTIPEGLDLTLDLNGHTLTGTKEKALVNHGTLTIEDSAGEGSIAMSGADSSDCYAVVNHGSMAIEEVEIECMTTGNGFAQGVNNTGTLTVEGGEISTLTTGSKWAIALFNTGVVTQLNGDLTGEIRNSATADVNALAVSNEADGVIKEISGGQLSARLDNNGIAFGIRNRGSIQTISGGEIYAVTTGVKYAYGLHNEASGRIGEISGGRLIGTIDRESNGNNALGVRNNGTIEAITGGEFRGTILGGGNAFGIRNDEGAIRNISGGMYRGNNFTNGLYVQGGTIAYADGFEMLSDLDHVGYRYVGRKGTIYTEILDEYENHIATYFFDRSQNLQSVLGDARDSYTVYQKYGQPVSYRRKTVEMNSEDFAKTGQTVTLIAHTTDQPVYYFLGSSVTIGFANNAVSFADYMAQENDWICHKRAISGTTLVDTGTKSYVQRLEHDIPSNARIDHLICQLSTNDASQNKPLGALSDSESVDTLDRTTIYGALEYIAYYCKNVLNCELSFYTNPKYTNSLYSQMIDAVYAVADKWDLQVLDFYNYKNMEALSDATLRSYMSDDIHPNAAGYHWMADEMSAYLKNYQSAIREAEQVTLDQTALELTVGDSAQLNATVLPEEAVDKRITWESSTPAVATVGETGEVTALAAGSATITAKTANGKQALCQVTVKEPMKEVQEITLNRDSLYLDIGDFAQLTAAVIPEDAADQTISWTSSDPSIASVDAQGKVTALCAGIASIIAQTANGTQALCQVTVKEPPVIEVQEVTLDLETLALEIGHFAQLTAAVIPETAADQTVSWSSSAPGIAAVDDHGKVCALAAGTAVITARSGNGRQAVCRVTVTQTLTPPSPPAQVPSTQVKVSTVTITGKTTLTAGKKAAYLAAVFPSNAANKAVSWSSSNPKVASVDAGSGTVTAKQAGKTTLTAAAKDGSGAKAVLQITVKPKKVKKLSVKVRSGKATVRFQKVPGVKKYTVRILKNGKLVKKATAGKKAQVTVKKKLKAGTYSVKVQYTKNGVKSDYTVKRFKVKKSK